MEFIAENIGTIIVAALVIAVVGLIVLANIKGRSSGKSGGCGCGCSGCPMSGRCHPEDQTTGAEDTGEAQNASPESERSAKHND